MYFFNREQSYILVVSPQIFLVKQLTTVYLEKGISSQQNRGIFEAQEEY